MLSALLCCSGWAQAVTYLSQEDFAWGTYIIDRPGTYRLTEDISFSPNSPARLTAAVADGSIPADTAEALGLPLAPAAVPASRAGMPLASQLRRTAHDGTPFRAGGPMTPNYDPAAYGLGFFAAIVIAADNVVLDLAGHRIEQSAEHALLQRFFAVIELAERPFIPSQGPADFGDDLVSANRVLIRNGTIGRSAHHGIHGNHNRNVVVANVNFEGYEVAALALNGVRGLLLTQVNATSRKDVPVLGTFSAARFLTPYLRDLVQRRIDISLITNGRTVTPASALARLDLAVNRVYSDVVAEPRSELPYPQIDPHAHPEEYALFHNPLGIVDGNAYGFLINNTGVAVNGFPTRSASDKANVVIMHEVTVAKHRAFINEIVTLTENQSPMIDPVGAVWQLYNRHPDTNDWLTIELDRTGTRYRGNLLADAQALVAKAALAGAFADSRLDVTRSGITAAALRWVEQQPGAATLEAALGSTPSLACNGDSMFHVNKGVIGFNVSAVDFALLARTQVHGLQNLGYAGSLQCGDYGNTTSHPAATLPGYGGAIARGYAFAGASNVSLQHAQARNITARSGDAVGVDLLTDSRRLRLNNISISGLSAGLGGVDAYEGPNVVPIAAGVRIGDEVTRARLSRICTRDLEGYGGAVAIVDNSQSATVRGNCRH